MSITLTENLFIFTIIATMFISVFLSWGITYLSTTKNTEKLKELKSNSDKNQDKIKQLESNVLDSATSLIRTRELQEYFAISITQLTEQVEKFEDKFQETSKDFDEKLLRISIDLSSHMIDTQQAEDQRNDVFASIIDAFREIEEDSIRTDQSIGSIQAKFEDYDSLSCKVDGLVERADSITTEQNLIKHNVADNLRAFNVYMKDQFDKINKDLVGKLSEINLSYVSNQNNIKSVENDLSVLLLRLKDLEEQEAPDDLLEEIREIRTSILRTDNALKDVISLAANAEARYSHDVDKKLNKALEDFLVTQAVKFDDFKVEIEASLLGRTKQSVVFLLDEHKNDMSSRAEVAIRKNYTSLLAKINESIDVLKEKTQTDADNLLDLTTREAKALKDSVAELEKKQQNVDKWRNSLSKVLDSFA